AERLGPGAGRCREGVHGREFPGRLVASRGPTLRSPDQRPSAGLEESALLCGRQWRSADPLWIPFLEHAPGPGPSGKVQELDFDEFIRFLKAHGHICTSLWYIEPPGFQGPPTTDADPLDFTVEPHPSLRTGPGLAADGKPKFDLTNLNPEYFDRI